MNKVLYSASDISNFENCKCHIINKIRISKGVKIKRKETTRTEDEYKNNVREGLGTYTFPDGTTKTGIWKDDELVTSN